MSQHPARSCDRDRAPAGWFCTRAKGHSGPCAAVLLEPAPVDDRGASFVHMGRTPPAAVPPLPDPRLLTCCLAIDPNPRGHGAVCHQTNGHVEPHDWEPQAPA